MPDDATLQKMYAVEYFDGDANAARFDVITDKLAGLEKGFFVDYGCGDGTLLRAVSDLGWKVAGIEFNPNTVKAIAAQNPFPVVLVSEPTPPADVLHLGDVIEHLTDLGSQLPDILKRLKPDGVLIAHNPLEGNPNVFVLLLKSYRRFRGGAVRSVPYHVTHATTRGQMALFERLGLQTISFDVTEVPFPAPRFISEANGLKDYVLYIMRKLSQVTSRVVGLKNHGNRYMFVGRKMPARAEAESKPLTRHATNWHLGH
jgi:SAM-dependent methyltransferase